MKANTARATHGAEPKAAHLKKVTLSSVSAINRKAASHSKEKTVQARPNTVQCSPEERQGKLLDRLARRVRKVTGTNSYDVADRLIEQTIRAQIGQMSQPNDLKISIAMDAIGELRPRGAMQAQLAVQMIATHEAGLAFLAAAHGAETGDANVLLAVQLLRLHLEQIETMRTLRSEVSRGASR